MRFHLNVDFAAGETKGREDSLTGRLEFLFSAICKSPDEQVGSTRDPCSDTVGFLELIKERKKRKENVSPSLRHGSLSPFF